MSDDNLKVLWQGGWMDGYLYLFCAKEDKEVKVIHYRIEFFEGYFTGTEHTSKNCDDLRGRISIGLDHIKDWYLGKLIEMKEDGIKNGLLIH